MNFPYSSNRMPVFAEKVVATSQPLAAQAGLRMMAAGGNAVDAALAAAITLTVVEPTSNGVGSDAFALVWDGSRLHGVNGSGRSPAAWTPAHFARYHTMPELGWDTVTVPGAVSLWAALSDRFGKLPFADLFQPAIGYARTGFVVSPIIAGQWAAATDRFRDFPHFADTFLLNGNAPAAGSRFRCRRLAETLESIAATRGASFYRGELAERIARHAADTGGSMTMDDLAAHRTEWVTPVTQAYRGIRVHEIPPNGQGLAALIALGILSHLDLGRYPMDSADSIHLQVEAMKIAFAEAFECIADPDWVPVPPGDLLEEDRLADRAEQIRMDRAGLPEACLPPGSGTVYLTAADAGDMMVSFIQSNFNGFGSGIVIPETGISLQNRGCGFSLAPGHPNRVDGGKRPYHTIIPGFVTQNGRPLMGFGVMGAHMQPQGHVQVIVRIFDYGLNPQAALDAPRWHVGKDGSLDFEKGIPRDVIRDLARRGHRINTDDPAPGLFGGGQIIRKLDRGYCAASDSRKDGQAVGF